MIPSEYAIAKVPNAYEVRVYGIAYGCEWAPDAMRRAYEAIVAAWTKVGFAPDRLGAVAPGLTRKWGSFKHKRKRLEGTNFERVETFSLSHLTAPTKHRALEDLYPDSDWLVYAAMTTWLSNIRLGWIPAIIGKPAAESMRELVREVLAISRARYGYWYASRFADFARRSGPPKTEVGDDCLTNSQDWEGARWQGTRVDTLLLRDVYQRNYLSAAHLDAPWGRTAMTLREWIEGEPAQRGNLGPYTELLTEWTPPQERIPEIREALFRAGRLFYYRFFRELDYSHVVSKDGRIAVRSDIPWATDALYLPISYPPERFHRPDIYAPWESPEPIPEIFRADFHRSMGDPSLAP